MSSKPSHLFPTPNSKTGSNLIYLSLLPFAQSLPVDQATHLSSQTPLPLPKSRTDYKLQTSFHSRLIFDAIHALSEKALRQLHQQLSLCRCFVSQCLSKLHAALFRQFNLKTR